MILIPPEDNFSIPWSPFVGQPLFMGHGLLDTLCLSEGAWKLRNVRGGMGSWISDSRASKTKPFPHLSKLK